MTSRSHEDGGDMEVEGEMEEGEGMSVRKLISTSWKRRQGEEVSWLLKADSSTIY